MLITIQKLPLLIAGFIKVQNVYIEKLALPL